MDEVRDHLADILSLYRTHSSTISSITSYLHGARRLVTTQLGPLLSSKPDLVTVFLLLVILFLSLKLLRLLVQTVLWWVRLVLRLAFWGGLVLAVGYIWVRGIEGISQDVGRWSGTWTDEYRLWEARGRAAQQALGGAGGSDDKYARGDSRWGDGRRARAW